MKKYSGVILFFAVLLCGELSYATFQSQSISTMSAEANLTGQGQVAMSIELKRVSDDVTVSSITWSGVTLPTGWKLADAYVLVHSTISATGGGIRIYTDNGADDANPKFGGTFGTGAGSGLIDTSTNTKVLPLAWLVKDSIGTPTANDPNTDQSWFYFKDKSQTDFWSTTDTKDYSTVKNENGIHFSQGSTNYGAALSPDPIYIECNFATAVTPRIYRTTTLRIEAFIE